MVDYSGHPRCHSGCGHIHVGGLVVLMNYVLVIKLCLQLVNKFMGRLDAKQQQQIGEDRAIKASLLNILVQVKTGKRIDAESMHYTSGDIERILSDHFRD